MPDPSHPADRNPCEIADAQAQAAETMEDDQRLLFEHAQRVAADRERTREIQRKKV